jgi:DNA primase
MARDHRQALSRDIYLDAIAPSVFAQLDRAFPEFGFVRDTLGWRATDEEATHRLLGVRAARVICHRPGGFYIHGEGPIPWTAYLNQGVLPAGESFRRIVLDLAGRAGVDASALDQPPDAAWIAARAVARVRASYFAHAHVLLEDRERGALARAYLGERGVELTAGVASLLGVAPHVAEARGHLRGLGHDDAAIRAAGVCADTRWAGRLVGAWRDQRGRYATLWARDLTDREDSDPRYLYLPGARRPSLPYLGYEALTERDLRHASELLLVEGVLDALALRARGIRRACALGGGSVTPATWAAVADSGICQLRLLFDNDAAGAAAAETAAATLMRAARAPEVLFVCPRRALGRHKDAAAFLRNTPGDAAARLTLNTMRYARAAVAYRLDALLPGDEADVRERRQALDHATAFLRRVPDRLCIERADAINQIAARLGVDAGSIARLAGIAPPDVTRLRRRIDELEHALVIARDALRANSRPPRLDDPAHLGRRLDLATHTVDACLAAERALDSSAPPERKDLRSVR